MSEPKLCLRRGYQCKCEQCQVWIERWNRELEAFAMMDKMIEEGKSLFHLYEWFSCNYPDMLQTHYKFIEDQYIERKTSKKMF